MGRVGELVLEYTRAGALDLETVADGQRALVRVRSVAPLPAAIARYSADALTQLRAALEHTIYAEVEEQLGRALHEDEGRGIEMPAALTWQAFDAWASDRRRSRLLPLQNGTQLLERIRALQPYQRAGSTHQHPLRVLVEHTNHAKHRAPAVAQTQLGAVIPDVNVPGLRLAEPDDDRAIEPGDVLVSSPCHTPVPLSIWPKVSIQRPQAGTWHILLAELELLADWVRLIAVARLIVGTQNVEPLPPQLDTTVGHPDPRAALGRAGRDTAAVRSRRRLEAGTVREGLVKTLALHPSSPDEGVLRRWVDGLSDEQVLEKQSRLPVTRGPQGLAAVEAAVLALLAEVPPSADA